MRYSLIVNGLGHAFLQEFGCRCDRCRTGGMMANTSVSLVGRDEKSNTIQWHALVDVGLGVVNSLCVHFPPEEARLDWLLFSHWHPDHSLELNRLCETMRRSMRRKDGQFHRIPSWFRVGTAQWIQKNYSYEWYRCLKPRISDESCPPGFLLEPVPLNREGITITPFSVSHYTADIDPADFKNKLYSSASFIIETGERKTILLWDVDNMNDWLLTAASGERARTLKRLRNADCLFIDCLSWNVEEVRGYNTGHLAFSTVKKYVQALHPKQTCLVHMSGHEDEEGSEGWGWENSRWQEEAKKVWRSEGLPGSVRVPSIGEEFPL